MGIFIQKESKTYIFISVDKKDMAFRNSVPEFQKIMLIFKRFKNTISALPVKK